ncbi:MAG: hypothetical protein IT322_17485 [Anaerolineae bacterium]|nr:hypothetical protein [Anaerolineae bacterium]
MSDHKLHFSKDGRFLFHGSYASVRVWHDRRLVKELPGKLVGTSLDGLSPGDWPELDGSVLVLYAGDGHYKLL